MAFRSIRWRLQAWYGALLLVLLTALGTAAYQLVRQSTLSQVDQSLERQTSRLADQLHSYYHQRGFGEGRRRRLLGPGAEEPAEISIADIPGIASALATAFASQADGEQYYVGWRFDDQVFARSENAPTQIPLPTRLGSLGTIRFRTRGMLREAYMFAPNGDALLVGRSLHREHLQLHHFAWWLVLFGASVLFLGMLGGWWLVGRALRPVHQIGATASRIAAGDLSQRINTEATDNELERLAQVLNSAFCRLESLISQQQRFTSDAAHELRTPLSVILTHTQGTLTRERSASEYRETVETCQRAAQRMRRLIESLLQLARLDAGQEPVQHVRFDASDTVHECVEMLEPLAKERSVQIEVDAPSLEWTGDPEGLGHVLTNLLSNAIRYNNEGGTVWVRLGSEAEQMVLTVSDSGLGIAESDLPHVFERFYRVDKARSRAQGGTGLGLAIAQAIVERAGGRIEVSSLVGRGSSFEVRLPM